MLSNQFLKSCILNIFQGDAPRPPYRGLPLAVQFSKPPSLKSWITQNCTSLLLFIIIGITFLMNKLSNLCWLAVHQSHKNRQCTFSPILCRSDFAKGGKYCSQWSASANLKQSRLGSKFSSQLLLWIHIKIIVHVNQRIKTFRGFSPKQKGKIYSRLETVIGF